MAIATLSQLRLPLILGVTASQPVQASLDHQELVAHVNVSATKQTLSAWNSVKETEHTMHSLVARDSVIEMS